MQMVINSKAYFHLNGSGIKLSLKPFASFMKRFASVSMLQFDVQLPFFCTQYIIMNYDVSVTVNLKHYIC